MAEAPTARDPRSTRWGEGAVFSPREERELDEHLELVPYVDLGVTFDHAACLAEAMALLPRFVPYQSDPRYGVKHWRGLALHALGGDPTRVAVANLGPGDRFEKTSVTAHCPTIMAVLDWLLDWERTHSVALLVLDPRSAIATHRDDPQYEVMRSLNLALNMPAGCEFVIDVERDGRDGPFTRRIPFEPGTAMMVNVAREHYVANRSDEPRIHIVARGPLTWPVGRILDRARAQNGIADEATLRRALDARYARLGRPSDHDPEPTRYQRKRLHEGTRPA